MPLAREYFDADLIIDDQLVEVRAVRITTGDALRAEMECHKQSIDSSPAFGQAITTVQMWCALTRRGEYPGDYQTFRNGGLDNYRLIKGDEALALELETTVPPTHEVAPSGPASPSLPGSPASPTGSTPTSTNV